MRYTPDRYTPDSLRRRNAASRTRLAVCLILLGLVGLPAAAQLRLPPLPTPPRLPLPDLQRDLETTKRHLEDTVDNTLAPLEQLDLRLHAVDELLQHRERIDKDPNGQPVVRGEVVVYSPSAAALAAAHAAGFTVARQRVLSGLGVTVVVLQAPEGVDTEDAVAQMRELDPSGTYDFNHLYTGGGAVQAKDAGPGAKATGATGPSAKASEPAGPVAGSDTARPRVGLIDGGIDAKHPALRRADVQHHGCDGAAKPTAHGTAVASLLVGRASGFSGAAPAAMLYAADVYCGQLTGGAVDALVEALDWMARERVPVVNISLVGPSNATLARVVAAVLARGHVVVAAVGNDGPAAPPLYPASYPGVVGVTAVDARDRVLPEAARGPQVAFAAPGADLAVAASGTEGYAPARGTSFASPIVAGLLASTGQRGEAAVAQLVRVAVDLGPPGRDPIYGYGLVGAKVRVSPDDLAAAKPVLSRADSVVR
jgi:subtilisin family serine protease